MRVIGTAGHVDHGKSTLVEALTGTDPDRWPEEKERGLTIDLGFATTELPSGAVAFVDVPGHERFLGTMVAGVGAVDACLFVVSAVEGWRAQSEEHLAVLGVLGITRGVVALTHVDRLDGPARQEARRRLAARLEGTVLASAEVVEVAVPAGIGVAALRDALDRLARATPPSPDRGRPRLWVDRSFTVRGAGTVVTGTLAGGSLATGDRVVVLPGGASSRIRSVQVHDAPRERVGPGHRVALNLPELAVSEVGRGQAVVEPDRWEPTSRFDAEVTVLASAGRPLGRRGAHLLHCGTGAWAVRLQVLPDGDGAPGPVGGGAIAAGTSGLARISLPAPLPLRPGDRFVIRDAGAGATVAGGEVLDVAPVLPVRRARPDRRWERVVDEHGWITAARLARLTGVDVAPTAGPWVVSAGARDEAEHQVVAAVDGSGPAGLGLSALDERQRALMQAGVDGLVVEDGVVRRPDGPGLEDVSWLVEARRQPFRPPPIDGVEPRVVRGLVDRGLVVILDGIAFPAEAVTAAAERLRQVAAAAAEAEAGSTAEEEAVRTGEPADGMAGLTVAEIRDVLGTTRRYVLALLGALDAAGITVRRGDRRSVVGAGLSGGRT